MPFKVYFLYCGSCFFIQFDILCLFSWVVSPSTFNVIIDVDGYKCLFFFCPISCLLFLFNRIFKFILSPLLAIYVCVYIYMCVCVCMCICECIYIANIYIYVYNYKQKHMIFNFIVALEFIVYIFTLSSSAFKWYCVTSCIIEKLHNSLSPSCAVVTIYTVFYCA